MWVGLFQVKETMRPKAGRQQGKATSPGGHSSLCAQLLGHAEGTWKWEQQAKGDELGQDFQQNRITPSKEEKTWPTRAVTHREGHMGPDLAKRAPDSSDRILIYPFTCMKCYIMKSPT